MNEKRLTPLASRRRLTTPPRGIYRRHPDVIVSTNESTMDRTSHNGTVTQSAQDYARIEKAIAFLRDHHLDQPDLAAVARHVHLSEFHFQRLFSRWAGISPKRFLQFLTVEHAKQQLAAFRALLDVSLDAGLSGPGRLHDLFVTLEAVTPGEFKSGGA